MQVIQEPYHLEFDGLGRATHAQRCKVAVRGISLRREVVGVVVEAAVMRAMTLVSSLVAMVLAVAKRQKGASGADGGAGGNRALWRQEFSCSTWET